MKKECNWCGKDKKIKYEKTRDGGVTWTLCCTPCANKTTKLLGHWLAGNLGIRLLTNK